MNPDTLQDLTSEGTIEELEPDEMCIRDRLVNSGANQLPLCRMTSPVPFVIVYWLKPKEQLV